MADVRSFRWSPGRTRCQAQTPRDPESTSGIPGRTSGRIARVSAHAWVRLLQVLQMMKQNC